MACIVAIEDCVNDEPRAARHGAVEPPQHSGGGVAADARVGDADVISLGAQQGFQARRPGFVGADSLSVVLLAPRATICAWAVSTHAVIVKVPTAKQ